MKVWSKHFAEWVYVAGQISFPSVAAASGFSYIFSLVSAAFPFGVVVLVVFLVAAAAAGELAVVLFVGSVKPNFCFQNVAT